MLDIRRFRDNPAQCDAGLAKRGLPPIAERISALDRAWRQETEALEALRARRNAAAKEIETMRPAEEDATAAAPGAPREDEAAPQRRRPQRRRQDLIAEMSSLKSAIRESEARQRRALAERDDLLIATPNLPDDDVPAGVDESDNVPIRFGGKPREDKTPEHDEIGRSLGLMDFDSAARMSGSRFVTLKGALSRLERALASFMLDMHAGEFGYCEISPPLLVRPAAMFGTGQLPKFSDQSFVTADDYRLIPTAEVPLTNLMREQTLDAADLPLRFVAWTPCFRREAGAAGRDAKGMFRQHQFSKVELVSLTAPAQSAAELERMTSCAEAALDRLGLAWRAVKLCAGDMSEAASKTYDIEVWLPSRGAYREISSCSVCGDYQARRMKTRLRGVDGASFAHTLNGSGVAVGRCMIALLETHWRKDGGVDIPPVLQPYMGGMTRIAPAG